MQTKLIEVLPFYIGCEFRIESVNVPFYARRNFADNGTIIKLGLTSAYSVVDGTIEGKPILRPLESITAEESEYICPAALEGKATIFVNAEMTAYLLKCGFDLFDLHSQGLCLYRDEKGGLY